MKIPFIVCCALLIGSVHGNGQITLRAGNTFEYQFHTLPFHQNSTFGIAEASGTVFMYVDPPFVNSLGPTNSYKVEMFEDTPAQTPILSRIISASSSIDDTSYTVPNAWEDLQGAIRVTALTGSIKLRGFSFEVLKVASPVSYEVYYTDRIFLPVPPVLAIASSDSAAVVRWPASGTNFVLESTANLALPQGWGAVTNQTLLSGGMLSVALDPLDARRFYRLRWLGP